MCFSFTSNTDHSLPCICIYLKMHCFGKVILILMFFKSSASKKSFTLLLDTTLSMQEEIDEIKENIGSVFSSIDLNEVENFILVTFNDPDVSPPSVFDSSEDLIRSLNSISVRGGKDCPENSLAGIQKALEGSTDESHIFVFTDAYSNDQSKLYDVQNLCSHHNSQVIIFLTGICLPVLPTASKLGQADVYYEVAKACRGGLFRLDPSNLKDAFKLIKEILKTDWTEITTQDVFTNYKEIQFSVESSETQIMLSVYGETPNIRVVDGKGNNARTQDVIHTDNGLVIQLLEPVIGLYQVTIRSRGRTGATLYKRHIDNFPFLYGFSTRLPKSFKETALRPIPGRTNFICISAENSTLEPKSLEMLSIGSNRKINNTLEKNNGNNQFYYTRVFFGSEASFRISITSHDTTNRQQNIVQSTIIFEPQKSVNNVTWTEPVVEILDTECPMVNYGDPISLACKVIGFPKPLITWTDDKGNTLAGEDLLLEIPNVHMSYIDVGSLRENITVSCKAKNAVGENCSSVDLLVKRNPVFEVKRTPEDTTIEYEGEGKLYCEVEAYPEATVTWFHNDTKLSPSFFDNVEIKPEDHALIIKKMSLDDVGEYKCEIKNDFEAKSFTGTVYISGLEAPVIGTVSTKIVMKPGDWTEIVCPVQGKPKPNVSWEYKGNDATSWTTIPDGIYSNDSKLKIPTFDKKYTGLYRCEASNVVGQDYRDITVTAEYEPIIKNIPETLTVKEGEQVELLCDVDAIPTARVRWEMTQDDVMIPFDTRHVTDANNTHRFEAFWKDSGNYHCIAENSVGRAEKTITVNVLVAPYIQAPESKMVTVRRASTISLPCNVLFGNPVPSVKWEFISLNSTTSVIKRTNATATLTIADASKKNEGAYICIADNEVGSDNIRIDLRVY